MDRFESSYLKAEEDELKIERQRKRGLVYILQMKEKEALAQFKKEHQFGYCPKCFGLIRLNGKCDNCD